MKFEKSSQLPERLIFTSRDISAKADASFDVWSFGVLMYELITDSSFFHCDKQGNAVDDGLQELANLTQ